MCKPICTTIRHECTTRAWEDSTRRTLRDKAHPHLPTPLIIPSATLTLLGVIRTISGFTISRILRWKDMPVSGHGVTHTMGEEIPFLMEICSVISWGGFC